MALLVNLGRDDADIGFSHGNDAGAVRSDETGLLAFHVAVYLYHVLHRDVFRNAHHQLKTCFHGLQDGVCRKGGRYENDRSIGTGHCHGVPDGIEYRHVAAYLACLSRCRTAYNVRTVSLHLFRMETGGLSCNALYNDLCIFMD